VKDVYEAIEKAKEHTRRLVSERIAFYSKHPSEMRRELLGFLVKKCTHQRANWIVEVRALLMRIDEEEREAGHEECDIRLRMSEQGVLRSYEIVLSVF